MMLPSSKIPPHLAASGAEVAIRGSALMPAQPGLPPPPHLLLATSDVEVLREQFQQSGERLRDRALF